MRGEGALDTAEEWKVFLVIARHRAVAEVVDELQAAHPTAAVIGGVASGHQLVRVREGARRVRESPRESARVREGPRGCAYL